VTKAADPAGRHVLDLSTGSGVVEIAAAQQRASSVTGWTSVPTAVLCSSHPLVAVDMDIRLGVTPRVDRRAV
jgi:predicted nicotinamide N-methyase